MVNYIKDRTDVGFLPSDGENLKAYAARLRSIAQHNRYAYGPTHEKFYTHYGPSSCFVCNFMDMLDYTISVLDDIWQSDKKATWSCEKDSGSPDIMAFKFVRHKAGPKPPIFYD